MTDPIQIARECGAAVIQPPLRNQPCGCVMCICGDEGCTFGCGRKGCAKHQCPEFIPDPVLGPITGFVVSVEELTLFCRRARAEAMEECAKVEPEILGEIKGRFQSEIFWRGVLAMKDAIRAMMQEEGR